MSETDMESLRKQAVGQAERFEVLSAEDVENLSKVGAKVTPIKLPMC
jgi:hypothetical protein